MNLNSAMHPEALDKQGEIIFPLLRHFPDFYLAGGTALALQIGHRKSIDFDLFSTEKISKELLGKVKGAFSEMTIEQAVNNPDELTIFASGVKVTFLAYPFPVLLPFTEYNGVTLLPIKEIAATKCYTIGRRGLYKDYIDIYFILAEQHSSLEEVVALAEKKYGGEFNSRLFLEQILYLEDVDDAEILFLKKPVERAELAAFFKQEVGKISL